MQISNFRCADEKTVLWNNRCLGIVKNQDGGPEKKCWVVAFATGETMKNIIYLEISKL